MRTVITVSIPRGHWNRVELGALISGSVLTVMAAMAAATVNPLAGLAVATGVGVLALVVARPDRAAYLYLGLVPLVAGFPRGIVVPQLRPTELLLVLVVLAVSVRFVASGLAGGELSATWNLQLTKLDRSIAAMAVFSSFVPLLWRAARGYRPVLDDLLFATAIWKYLVVFVLFRVVVSDEMRVRRCVTVILGVGALVGAIAILQSLNVAGVPAFLARVYGEPLQSLTNNRGSSTLGTSHGMADLMAFNLALCLALWHRRVFSPTVAGVGAAFFGLACLASGQFSAALALLVVAVSFGLLTGRVWRTIAVAIPGLAVAGIVLWPVVQARLLSTNQSGVPNSWEARRFNLTNYFWSQLFRDGNWILGVRPSARLPSFEPWRDWVYIESGHTWLLWTGGIPLLVAYLWFSWHGFRGSSMLAHTRPGIGGPRGLAPAVGLATAIILLVVFVLMLFDTHLTLRGPADVLFPMLAMITVPGLWDDHVVRDHAIAGWPVFFWRERL